MNDSMENEYLRAEIRELEEVIDRYHKDNKEIYKLYREVVNDYGYILENNENLRNDNKLYEGVFQQNIRYREVIEKVESVLSQDGISISIAKYTALIHLRKALEESK